MRPCFPFISAQETHVSALPCKMEESQLFGGPTLGGFHPADYFYLFVICYSIVCSRKLLSVCYPLTPGSVELSLLPLSAIHLEMVTSISHQRLLSVQGALCSWQRRSEEGTWLLVSSVVEMIIKVANLTFLTLFVISLSQLGCMWPKQPPSQHRARPALLAGRPLSPAPFLPCATSAFPLLMIHLWAKEWLFQFNHSCSVSDCFLAFAWRT